MKSFFTVLATGMICLCVYCSVKKLAETWLTVELLKMGAPILKKATTK